MEAVPKRVSLSPGMVLISLFQPRGGEEARSERGPALECLEMNQSSQSTRMITTTATTATTTATTTEIITARSEVRIVNLLCTVYIVHQTGRRCWYIG